MCLHAISSLFSAIWPISEAKLGRCCYKWPPVCLWLKIQWSEKVWYCALWFKAPKGNAKFVYSLDKWRRDLGTQLKVIIAFFTLVLQGWGKATLSQLSACQSQWSCAELSYILVTFMCGQQRLPCHWRTDNKKLLHGSTRAAQAQRSVNSPEP